MDSLSADEQIRILCDGHVANQRSIREALDTNENMFWRLHQLLLPTTMTGSMNRTSSYVMPNSEEATRVDSLEEHENSLTDPSREDARGAAVDESQGSEMGEGLSAEAQRHKPGFRPQLRGSTSSFFDSACDIDAMFAISGMQDAPQGHRHSFIDTVQRRASKASISRKPWSVAYVLLYHWLKRCSELQEPIRTGRLASFVFSNRFNALSTLVILANSVFVVYTTDYDMKNIGGAPQTEEMFLTEFVLACFYVIELSLKLAVHRLYFFVNHDWGFNNFDFLLVAVSVFENSVIFSMKDADGQSGLNIGFLRLIRICKIVKVLRVFRTLRFFTELRLMLDCVVGSCMNVFWCTIMLFFVMYVFALLLLQGISSALIGGIEESEEIMIRQCYDSVGKTIVTLFQVSTGGIDWQDCYEPLTYTGYILPAAMLLYVAVITISVWNIVTSTFIEKALKLAKPDVDTLVMEQQISDFRDSQVLVAAFVDKLGLDDQHCKITLEDFETLSSDYDFRAYLNARGIDIKNAHQFFGMLAGMKEDGEVDVLSLANGCVRMKGLATSIELQTLGFETKMIIKEQRRAFQQIFKKLAHVERRVGEQHGTASGQSSREISNWQGSGSSMRLDPERTATRQSARSLHAADPNRKSASAERSELQLDRPQDLNRKPEAAPKSEPQLGPRNGEMCLEAALDQLNRTTL
eukprot:TRINITY_DN47098_c0_g1_i1.p1 TRINITY_DN47098_c0_g1~~TRINITY_DN47098_c0_g1_i1.p1  ORF type:complete len:692 (-),score=105.51 TRINITY_DN47098_c0_g1_i1:48-2123(-)